MPVPESTPRLFLTVRETAAALRVDPATIYRAIRSGSFPAVRVRGRYVVPSRAVDEFATRAVDSGSCIDASEVTVTAPPGSDRSTLIPRPRGPAPAVAARGFREP